MKRWLLVVLCCVQAASAYADLHVLLGPSVLIDTQDEIVGTALGLNVTIWGLVPKSALASDMLSCFHGR